MFVVDISGSNSSTDSYGSKRADNIDSFVTELSSENMRIINMASYSLIIDDKNNFLLCWGGGGRYLFY